VIPNLDFRVTTFFNICELENCARARDCLLLNISEMIQDRHVATANH